MLRLVLCLVFLAFVSATCPANSVSDGYGGCIADVGYYLQASITFNSLGNLVGYPQSEFSTMTYVNAGSYPTKEQCYDLCIADAAANEVCQLVFVSPSDTYCYWRTATSYITDITVSGGSYTTYLMAETINFVSCPIGYTTASSGANAEEDCVPEVTCFTYRDVSDMATGLETVAGSTCNSGDTDAVNLNARFGDALSGFTFDVYRTTLYFWDYTAIKKYDTTSGQVTTLLGDGSWLTGSSVINYLGQCGTSFRFTNQFKKMAVTLTHLYVVQREAIIIFQLSDLCNTNSLTIGTLNSGGTVDGVAQVARFGNDLQIAMNPAMTKLAVIDKSNHRLAIVTLSDNKVQTIMQANCDATIGCDNVNFMYSFPGNARCVMDTCLTGQDGTAYSASPERAVAWSTNGRHIYFHGKQARSILKIDSQQPHYMERLFQWGQAFEVQTTLGTSQVNGHLVTGGAMDIVNNNMYLMFYATTTTGLPFGGVMRIPLQYDQNAIKWLAPVHANDENTEKCNDANGSPANRYVATDTSSLYVRDAGGSVDAVAVSFDENHVYMGTGRHAIKRVYGLCAVSVNPCDEGLAFIEGQCSAQLGYYLENNAQVACPQYMTSNYFATSASDCFCEPTDMVIASGSCQCPSELVLNTDEDACIAAVGYYCEGDAGSLTCTACPQFTTTVTTGAVSQDACVAAAGYYSSVVAGPMVNVLTHACVGYWWSSITVTPPGLSVPAASTSSTSLEACWNYCDTVTAGESCLKIFVTASFQCYYHNTPDANLADFDFSAGGTHHPDNFNWCQTNPSSSYNTYVAVPTQSTTTDYLACPGGTTSDVGATSIDDCYSLSVTCPANQYRDEADDTLCLPCPSNSESAEGSVGIGSCVCITGFAGNLTTDSSCTSCDLANNQYAPMHPLADCMTCPTGSQSESVSRASFCLCKAGHFLNSDSNCQQCNIGDYKPSVGNETCTDCPDPDTTSAIGSDELVDCVCLAGYYYPDASNSQECDPCPQGSFQSGQGQSFCSTCGTGGTTEQSASVSASQCVANAGYTGADGSASFTPCPSGTYKGDTGSAACTPCPADSSHSGTAATTINTCTCNSGFTGADGGVCTQCTAGTFDDGLTPGTCQQCYNDPDQELYLGHTGTSLSLVTSLDGSADCTICVENAQQDTSYSDGVRCKCNAGYFREFVAGHFNSFGGEFMTTYDAGNIFSQGARCTACPSNTYKTQTGNQLCEDNPTWQDTNSWGCAEYSNEWAQHHYSYYGFMDSLLQCCHPARDFNSEPHDFDTYPSQLSLTRWEASQCTICPVNSGHVLTGQASASACQCNAGYTGPDGGPCVACAGGTFKASTGSAACDTCPSNSGHVLQGEIADTNCECNAGYTGHAHACTQCATGTYKQNSGSAACSDCDANADSPEASVSSTQCVCNAGFEGADGHPCTACGAGQFENAASHVCEDCPAHSSSPSGSTGVTACVCNAGYSGPDGGSCAECQSGTYKTGVGSHGCSNCFVDTTSTAGSVASADCQCNAGYEDVRKVTESDPILQPGTNLARACGSNFDERCPTDARNSYNADHAHEHLNDGDYTTKYGSSTQTYNWIQIDLGREVYVEEAHYFNDLRDCCRTRIDKAELYVSNEDSRQLIVNSYDVWRIKQKVIAGGSGTSGKAVGTFDSSCYDNCVFTIRRTFRYIIIGRERQYDKHFNMIELEVYGFGGESGTTNLVPCVQCLVNEYSLANSLSCTPCLANSGTSGPAATTITSCQCNLGYTGPDGGVCGECLAGKYKSSVGSDSCVSCDDNAYSPSASTALTACACNAGYAGENGAVCQQCGAGKYEDTASHLCTDCVLNSNSDAGSSQSTDCVCNAGYFGPNGGPCEECPVNTFCPTGTVGESSSTPQYSLHNSSPGQSVYLPACPSHSISLAGSESIADCECTYGYTGPNGGPCNSCAISKYKDAKGSAACTDCPSNAYSPPASTDSHACVCNAGYTVQHAVMRRLLDHDPCTACATGKYKSSVSDAACTDCPANSDSPSASHHETDCICDTDYLGPPGGPCGYECPAGNTADETNTACEPCAAGKFKAAAGSGACTDCPANSVANLNGATSVESCVCEWGYVRSGAWPHSISGCESCPSGKFNNYDGEEQCFDCLIQNIGNLCDFLDTSSGNQECNQICNVPPGYGANLEQTNIELCGLNTYNDGTFVFCETCPSGSSHADIARTSINACVCHVGYTRVSAGTACTACKAGKYKLSTGDAACTPCPSNSMSLNASDAVDDCFCNAGYTGPNGGACDPCTAGTYKDTAGSHACSTCPASSTSVPSSTSISACQCNAGFTGADGGVCTVCDAGKYKDGLGSAQCTTCPAFSNSTAGSAALNDCTCNPGYEPGGDYCVLNCQPGQTGSGGVCVNCEHGKYKNTFGSSPCLVCPDPTNASALGSHSLGDCVCRAGEFGAASNSYEIIRSLGDYSSVAIQKDMGDGAVCLQDWFERNITCEKTGFSLFFDYDSYYPYALSESTFQAPYMYSTREHIKMNGGKDHVLLESGNQSIHPYLVNTWFLYDSYYDFTTIPSKLDIERLDLLISLMVQIESGHVHSNMPQSKQLIYSCLNDCPTNLHLPIPGNPNTIFIWALNASSDVKVTLHAYTEREVTTDVGTYKHARWLHAQVGDYVFHTQTPKGTECRPCPPGIQCRDVETMV